MCNRVLYHIIYYIYHGVYLIQRVTCNLIINYMQNSKTKLELVHQNHIIIGGCYIKIRATYLSLIKGLEVLNYGYFLRY